MTDSPIDWTVRKNTVNERKAEWLTKNSDQLKLIQYVIARAYDEYQESENSEAADLFIDTCDDAFRSLFTIVADLRGQDFMEGLDKL